jgi:hypothetical protein
MGMVMAYFEAVQPGKHENGDCKFWYSVLEDAYGRKKSLII